MEVQCSSLHYCAVQYSVMQYSVVQCNTYTVQSSAVSSLILNFPSVPNIGGSKVPLYMYSVLCTLHCTLNPGFTSWGLPLVKLSPWEEGEGADKMAALPLTE